MGISNLPINNISTLRETFTPEEKSRLESDGALIYQLTGQTIEQQREAREKLGLPSFGLIPFGEQVTKVPSRQIEVAIYPDPGRFFIPGSFSKFAIDQERMAEEDARELRKRLRLPKITQIIPDEAATVTELIFQHLDKTGVWLLGDAYSRYTKERGIFRVMVRTKNPSNKKDWLVNVGFGVNAVSLSGWHHYSSQPSLGALRLIVPTKHRLDSWIKIPF
jgi:hypothetical protein